MSLTQETKKMHNDTFILPNLVHFAKSSQLKTLHLTAPFKSPHELS